MQPLRDFSNFSESDYDWDFYVYNEPGVDFGFTSFITKRNTGQNEYKKTRSSQIKVLYKQAKIKLSGDYHSDFSGTYNLLKVLKTERSKVCFLAEKEDQANLQEQFKITADNNFAHFVVESQNGDRITFTNGWYAKNRKSDNYVDDLKWYLQRK